MAKAKKVPKSVFGMKLPKQLRKAGIVKMAFSSPVGRLVLAEALVAAAGAAAAALAKHHPSKEQLGRAREEVLGATQKLASSASEGVGAAVGTLGHVVAEIAKTATGGDDKGSKGKDKEPRH
jgi:hypothetical protein